MHTIFDFFKKNELRNYKKPLNVFIILAATSVTFRFHDPQYSNNLPVKGYVVQYVKENEDFSNAKTMQWPFGKFLCVYLIYCKYSILCK